jgi:hypothetical protein
MSFGSRKWNRTPVTGVRKGFHANQNEVVYGRMMVPVFVKDQSIRIMFGRMTLFMIERMTIVRIGYSRSLMNSATEPRRRFTSIGVIEVAFPPKTDPCVVLGFGSKTLWGGKWARKRIHQSR